MGQLNLKDYGLDNTSFKPQPEAIKPQIVIAIEGVEKQGKTHFALTAPGPICYQGVDIGDHGVVQKFMGTKKVFPAHYTFNMKEGAEAADKLLDQFMSDYMRALSSKARTIIWDTATEVWEILRMARFGKLAQVMPHNYGPVNAEYREMLRRAYESDKNLILLHKMKAEWEGEMGKGRKTGQYVRNGFTDTGYLVQVNATVYRQVDKEAGDRFCLRVKDCRQNPDIAGVEFAGGRCNFPTLASWIFPGSKEEDWS